MVSIFFYISTTVLILFTITYLYFKNKYSYFQRRNISYIAPTMPIGNVNIHFFKKFADELKNIYKIFKKRNEKLGGIYLLTKPTLILIDPELIKSIITKDFNHFTDRGIYYNEEKEFITAHLFNLKSPEWKALRAKLSPAFSSSNLKNMIEMLVEKTKDLEEKLQELSESSSCFEAKEIALRVTIDMFCSVGFGIDCNSFQNPNNGFYKTAAYFVNNNIINTIKIITSFLIPAVFEKLNLKLINVEFTNFFIPAITEIVEFRERNAIKRPDVMNLLIKLKNTKNKTVNGGITLKQLISQCLVFYVGGFDTSATTISYCIFELAQNQDIQNKLREEICVVLKKNNEKITYEAIQDMHLLHRVIAETMRKYPPLVVLNRKCVKDYTIPDSNTKIEKGTSIMIPVIGLHHDPVYYPEPEKFDPERFSGEEKAKRHPYTYLPFGNGPRNCIGLRLGQLQTKIGLIKFLKNFKYTTNPKTKLPLKFKTTAVLLSTDGHIWIDVNKV